MNLVAVVEQFLRQYLDLSRPFLLALSGGPDSLCLFYCLLTCQEKIPFVFHVAHVDHGWRPESQKEAQILKNLMKLYQIPYHEQQLNPEDMTGNLEAACRLARYQFFAALCQDYALQGVLIGHQRDDQIETVLKKILEGSPLASLGGLKSCITLYGVEVFRPLLNVTKQEILNWLNEKKIHPFEDCTNEDPRFLRTRMRQTLIPLLNKEFGKRVESSFLSIGEEAQELRDYLDEQVQEGLKNILESPWGSCLDLQVSFPSHLYELKHLLRRFFSRCGLSLPRSLLLEIARMLKENTANRVFKIMDISIWVDRRRLFVLLSYPHWNKEPVLMNWGSQELEGWKIEVKEVEGKTITQPVTSWREAWQGNCLVYLPLKDYQLGLAKANTPYHGKTRSISKWLNNHKIPSFLTSIVPVIWHNQEIYHEFLTGKSFFLDKRFDSTLEIRLSYL